MNNHCLHRIENFIWIFVCTVLLRTKKTEKGISSK